MRDLPERLSLYGLVEFVIFLRGLYVQAGALRRLDIETRVRRMEQWWMDPNDLGLISQRALERLKQ